MDSAAIAEGFAAREEAEALHQELTIVEGLANQLAKAKRKAVELDKLRQEYRQAARRLGAPAEQHGRRVWRGEIGGAFFWRETSDRAAELTAQDLKNVEDLIAENQRKIKQLVADLETHGALEGLETSPAATRALLALKG